MQDLLSNLNKEQLKAVMHKEGPVLIVAGAGTGKTTVISQRIAYLIEQGLAESDEILALTFTEKAAGEMEERVDSLLPIGYLDLWISTFHSFGEKVLRSHGIEIGLPGDFKLLNEYEQYSLIKKNLDKFDLDHYKPMGNPTKFINALLKHFSRAKDEDISPLEYLEYAEELKANTDTMLAGRMTKKKAGELSKILKLNNESEAEDLKEIAEQEIKRINEVANAYHTYQQLLLDESALDFGDLINYTLKLFRERKKVLEDYRGQFKFIMLDEFQDTNLAQYELIKLLAAPKNNLVVVGDDDQCLPGNAMIETPGGDKRIDRIKPGERVATAVGKGYLSYSSVTRVNKEKKSAIIISFTTKSGRTLQTTDNHKLFCFTASNHNWKKSEDKRFWYVYLMQKKELGWRIGISKDIYTRLKLERSADRLVAIRSFESEEEARYHETLWSLQYSIPSVCFQERNGVMDKKKYSQRLYQEIDVDKGVESLCSDLNIDKNAHQVSLAAVNRGNKLRLKINLEMCSRNYRSKYAKNGYLSSPQVLHTLKLETSDKATISKLEKEGFKLQAGRGNGKRLRQSSADLVYLGKIAGRISKISGADIENSAKIGRLHDQHKKSLVIPAKNVLRGMYLPVKCRDGIRYEQVVKREARKKTLTVYDLEVAKTHNFLANGLVVHNSIYKFRGASVSNILQFQKDYTDSTQIYLNRNYRNRQEILDLSYEFIKLNDPNRLEYRLANEANKENKKKRKQENNAILNKKLKAQIEGEAVIEVLEESSLEDEVNKVVTKIAELKIENKEATWSDFAILVRANDAAKEFSNALDLAGLPYQFLSSRGLYAKDVVLDVIAYLKLLDNYHESPAVFRVINLPIFDFTYQEIVNFNYFAKKKAWSLFEVLKSFPNVNARLREKIEKFLKLVDKHTKLARFNSVSEVIIAFVNESGYLKHLMDQAGRKASEDVGYLNQFLKRAKSFEASSDDKRVKEFLHELNLEMEAGEQGSLPFDPDSGPEAIKIMTVHAAKGLEFEYVFLANMVDQRFPTIERKEPIAIPEDLVKETLPEGDIHTEEERRLFYVALTRAKSHLYLTWAPDYGGTRKKKPSRFLVESGLVQGKEATTQGTSVQTVDKQEKPSKKKPASQDLSMKEKIKEPVRQKINIPSYFSHTQLTAFKNCPYQYYFAHIVKVPTRGKFVFSFGQAMHLTLQKLFELVREKRGLGQGDLFGQTKTDDNKVNISLDEVFGLYEKCWVDDWYESKKDKEKYRQKGRDILEEFFKKHKDNWPQVESLEQGVNLKIGGYRIFGKIDRVDNCAEEGLQIVDYKTGRPKKQDAVRAEDKEQLLIYQLAMEQAVNQEIKNLQFYYLENNTEINFLGTVKEKEKMEEKIIERINGIKEAAETGCFPAKPGPLCKYCDFNSICEFRKN